ncbi:MAG: NUDIX hydrolase, partial [Myxococcota bacterium]
DTARLRSSRIFATIVSSQFDSNQDKRLSTQDEDKALDASTVMILREAPDGFQVFMVRRHSGNEFLANRYVYPGGKLDAEDCTPDASEHVEGMTPEDAKRRLDEDIDPYDALGLFLAGVRETFEESGLLLARRSDEDNFIDLTSNPNVARRFSTYREQLQDGDISLSEVAEREDLVFPMQWLGYFAHWITPFIESKRFDTRFFVCLAPAHQEPLHDERETTEGLWLTPTEALERSRGDDFLLAPPTLRTLQQLSDFTSASDALEFARSYVPPTILPHMEMSGEEVLLYLPGDPSFPADDPRYANAEPVESDVTCLRMVSMGKWDIVNDG